MDPGQPSGISPTADSPAWGSSFGTMAGASSPLLLQKGKFTSSALVPLAPYIPSRFGKRLLRTLQQRGLITLEDLTNASTEGLRQWLPPDIQAAILPFPPPAFPPHPPDHHPPPRMGQFSVLKGTSSIWGGIYQLVRIASYPPWNTRCSDGSPTGHVPTSVTFPKSGLFSGPSGLPTCFPLVPSL